MLSTLSMPTFPPRAIDAAVQAPAPAGAVAVEPLLPRVAMGDEAAFAACVGRYGKLVYALAHRTLRSERDVDDACQEIFFALWRSASSFDPAKASEATFVAMIARRRLVDRLRAPGTRPLPVAEPPSAPSASAVDAYVDARKVATALEGCHQDQRQVIVLAAVSGLTHAEISTELGMPLGTVKSHYARGIERIRRMLFRGEGRS